jgi:outer membrane receptor protein involved in Fe transport
MDVVRARVGSAVEWVVAAVFLLATLAVGSLVLRELRAAASATPSATLSAAVTATAPPAHIPEKAVSVPLLILAPEKEIRVGDTAARVAAVLGREAETGVQQSDIGPLGERTTRFYDFSGTRFALVYESPEKGGAHKVTAIYLQ